MGRNHRWEYEGFPPNANLSPLTTLALIKIKCAACGAKYDLKQLRKSDPPDCPGAPKQKQGKIKTLEELILERNGIVPPCRHEDLEAIPDPDIDGPNPLIGKMRQYRCKKCGSPV